MSNVTPEELAERARKVQQQAAELGSDTVKPWDETADPVDRVGAYLDFESHPVWITAESQAVANRWIADNNLPAGRFKFVNQGANLNGLSGSSMVVVVDGADMHPQWRRISKAVEFLRSLDAYIVTADKPGGPGLSTIGGVQFTASGAVVVVEPRPGNPVGQFAVCEPNTGSGTRPRAIAWLDRAQVEKLRSLCDAYLTGEPMPDPEDEQAERIRRQIEATGSIFGAPT